MASGDIESDFTSLFFLLSTTKNGLRIIFLEDDLPIKKAISKNIKKIEIPIIGW